MASLFEARHVSSLMVVTACRSTGWTRRSPCSDIGRCGIRRDRRRVEGRSTAEYQADPAGRTRGGGHDSPVSREIRTDAKRFGRDTGGHSVVPEGRCEGKSNDCVAVDNPGTADHLHPPYGCRASVSRLTRFAFVALVAPFTSWLSKWPLKSKSALTSRFMISMSSIGRYFRLATSQ